VLKHQRAVEVKGDLHAAAIGSSRLSSTTPIYYYIPSACGVYNGAHIISSARSCGGNGYPCAVCVHSTSP
jgi:hypothetical protein